MVNTVIEIITCFRFTKFRIDGQINSNLLQFFIVFNNNFNRPNNDTAYIFQAIMSSCLYSRASNWPLEFSIYIVCLNKIFSITFGNFHLNPSNNTNTFLTLAL